MISLDVEPRRSVCYLWGSVLARPRLFAGIAAAILSAASLVQVGCGVFHCAERPEVAAGETPSCHGGDERRPTHAPGGGEEDCCRTLPLERSSSHAALSVPELALAAVVVVPTSHAIRERFASRASIDTGPPSGHGVASMTPLRI